MSFRFRPTFRSFLDPFRRPSVPLREGVAGLRGWGRVGLMRSHVLRPREAIRRARRCLHRAQTLRRGDLHLPLALLGVVERRRLWRTLPLGGGTPLR